MQIRQNFVHFSEGNKKIPGRIKKNWVYRNPVFLLHVIYGLKKIMDGKILQLTFTGGMKNIWPRKKLPFQFLRQNYDFRSILAQKTAFMPNFRLIYERNPPQNFIWARFYLLATACF